MDPIQINLLKTMALSGSDRLTAIFDLCAAVVDIARSCADPDATIAAACGLLQASRVGRDAASGAIPVLCLDDREVTQPMCPLALRGEQ